MYELAPMEDPRLENVVDVMHERQSNYFASTFPPLLEREITQCLIDAVFNCQTIDLIEVRKLLRFAAARSDINADDEHGWIYEDFGVEG